MPRKSRKPQGHSEQCEEWNPTTIGEPEGDSTPIAKRAITAEFSFRSQRAEHGEYTDTNSEPLDRIVPGTIGHRLQVVWAHRSLEDRTEGISVATILYSAKKR
jgi:hypothetical protein